MGDNGNQQSPIYVSVTGLPLRFRFEWPFQKSTSGADFWYLHADIRLATSADLHALVAVNLSATLREVIPSLEPRDTEGSIINALRKEVDRKQLEFVKSAKLVPVHFSSRHYSFKNNKWVFEKAGDEAIHLAELGNMLVGQGLIKLERRYATALPPLMAQAERFESDAAEALGELEKKHAFERG